MHRYQTAAPAPNRSSNEHLQKQVHQLNAPAQATPYNQFVDQYASPPITNLSNTIPNHIGSDVPAGQPREGSGDFSNVALPELLNAINPHIEPKWKLDAADAYNILLSNHPSTPQQEMSAYLDQLVAANSAPNQRGGFMQSRNHAVHPEGSIPLISNVQQVPSTQAILAFAAQQPSQPQNVAPMSTMPPSTDPTVHASVPGPATTVNMAPTLSRAPVPVGVTTTPTFPEVVAGALPAVSGSRIQPSRILSQANIGPHSSVADTVRPATISGAECASAPVVDRTLLTGTMMTRDLAAHPAEAAPQVLLIPKDSVPMGPGGSLGLLTPSELDVTNTAGQILSPHDAMRTGAIPSTPALPSATNVHQASPATHMLVNMATTTAAAAATKTTTPAMKMTQGRLNQAVYGAPITQPTLNCETGKQKGNPTLKTSRSPRKTKVSEELPVKLLKKEEVPMKIEVASGSQGDETGTDDAETKKAMRAERNRQSAAASRERKKHYIKELEKRVGVLSKANAEIQIEQIELMKETIAAEKERLLTVTFQDMEIAKLRNQIAELSPSPLAEQAKLRRKTWDSADWASQMAKMNLSD